MAHLTVGVHADVDELGAHQLSGTSTVLLTVGSLTLFPEAGSQHATKAAARAWLARWAELVEALPDDQGP